MHSSVANLKSIRILRSQKLGLGGIYEWKSNASDVKWSQGYQSEIVAADATFAMGNDHVSGLTIWQMTDIKANIGDTKECGACEYAPHPQNITVPWNCASSSDRCGRPRGENNKGGGEHGRLHTFFPLWLRV
eukprot:COSAG04_NODE_4409_length_2111_cov_1.228628_2_plen_132_part_00